MHKLLIILSFSLFFGLQTSAQVPAGNPGGTGDGQAPATPTPAANTGGGKTLTNNPPINTKGSQINFASGQSVKLPQGQTTQIQILDSNDKTTDPMKVKLVVNGNENPTVYDLSKAEASKVLAPANQDQANALANNFGIQAKVGGVSEAPPPTNKVTGSVDSSGGNTLAANPGFGSSYNMPLGNLGAIEKGINSVIEGVNRVNGEVGDLNGDGSHNDKDCDHDHKPRSASSRYAQIPYEHEFTEQVDAMRKDGYLPGCEALVDFPIGRDSLVELNQCLTSIKDAIHKGLKRNNNGQINRESLMCNMFWNLNAAEQEFAALVFTSAGEAGVFGTAEKYLASPPHYQEQAFTMLSMVTRAKRLAQDRKDNISKDFKVDSDYNSNNPNYYALDVVFSKKQYSMYNEGIFYGPGDKMDFSRLFEKDVRGEIETWLDNGVEAFIALKSGKIVPGEDSGISYYFNPEALGSNTGISDGEKWPSSWDSRNNYTEIRPEFNDGKGTVIPNRGGGQRHRFFKRKDGNLSYGEVAERYGQCGQGS